LKENTKYHNYRFVGKINVDEIQPWFDFTTAKPWDEGEIPWVMENKVRREILIHLSNGPKNFEELYETINFSPKPLIISKEVYECNVSYQWTRKTLENHLQNLEWYDLIKKSGYNYELTFPILKMDKMAQIEIYISKFAEHWIKIIQELKDEISSKLGDIEDKVSIHAILIEKAVEKLYLLLKNENILPDVPNIRALWAEQLREMKFEDWVNKNF
jgi:predicted transcriptional regulator